jgi:hypothetical protein
MKTTMASRERVLATIAGQRTDHVPFCFEIHPSYQDYDPSVARWADQFERTEFLLSLGLDPMTEVWLPDPGFHPDVHVRQWREDNTDDGYAHLCREYETPAGTLRQVIRETDDLYAWHKLNRNTRWVMRSLPPAAMTGMSPVPSCGWRRCGTALAPQPGWRGTGVTMGGGLSRPTPDRLFV